MIHTVEGFGVANKAEVCVFLKLSCFFYDPMHVGNLISGFSAFSKSSLSIWMFTVLLLLKPGLENFEHYFASVWDECNCAGVWTFLSLPFFCNGMKSDLFQSCGHCWVFQICLGMVLITASCTMSQTSIHSSSGTLSIRSNSLNLIPSLGSHPLLGNLRTVSLPNSIVALFCVSSIIS